MTPLLVVDVLLGALALPWLVASAYLFGLALLAFAPRRAPQPSRSQRFDVIIPAHDEETGIEQTVRSLLAVAYPEAQRRVIVVADNCTDNTAECARRAGALVLERQNEKERGKGYALAFAFERTISEGFANAVVVVDADTSVSPNLLDGFSARLDRGAKAMQAEYGVRNPDASWRTRLMSLAFTLFHRLRNLARERVRASTGLHGNGMCFSVDLLTEVPHDAFSIVEDLEYGIRLGYAGHRVHYVHEADVRGDMVASEKTSRSQRQRWEQGRHEIKKTYLRRLIVDGLRRPDRVLFDLGMDLAIPPLSRLVVPSFAAALASGAATAAGYPMFIALSTWTACGIMLAAYVFRGCMLSDAGIRVLVDLAAAPAYVLWRATLKLRRASSGEWVRTEREQQQRAGSDEDPTGTSDGRGQP